VQPSHLIDRSLGGDDDPRAIVPLCPQHHREYDDGFLSLVEYLEPYYREEVAYAVLTVGIVRALERLTNERWAPLRRRCGLMVARRATAARSSARFTPSSRR
jgi:hypothetical protein